jgi:hypothetical protein
VKLFLIGGVVGAAIGVGLTVFYFALADFFRVQANLGAGGSSELAKKTQEPHPLQAKQKAAGLK